MNRERAIAIWIGCLLVATASQASCIRSQDAMAILSNRLEAEADALLLSQAPDVTMRQIVELDDGPWTLIFVPRTGFDRDAAARAGVSEDLGDEIVRRAQAWGGAALIVYAAPRVTSITRLADKIDIKEQIGLQGSSGKIELAIGLSRMSEAALISAAVARSF